MSRFLKAMAVMAATATLLMGAAVIWETRFIYFPQRQWDATPAEMGLDFEDVELVSDDGVRLHAWFLPRPNAPFTVLVFHGNAGNVSHRLDRAVHLQTELGASVLLFDYRGYGRSEGEPSEAGTYRDGRAAFRYLLQDRAIAAGNVVLFGESLGAAVALQTASETPVRALILEAAFTSISDMAHHHYPFLPLGRLLRTRYDNLNKIRELRTPLLIFHGTRDEVVPFEQGERMFRTAPHPKRFFPVPGAGHNDVYSKGGEAYWEVWRDFLAQEAPASK